MPTAQGLDWAKTHDAEAKKIAEAAQTFAMRNLNRQARLCYMFQLITELSKNFKWVRTSNVSSTPAFAALCSSCVWSVLPIYPCPQRGVQPLLTPAIVPSTEPTACAIADSLGCIAHAGFVALLSCRI